MLTMYQWSEGQREEFAEEGTAMLEKWLKRNHLIYDLNNVKCKTVPKKHDFPYSFIYPLEQSDLHSQIFRTICKNAGFVDPCLDPHVICDVLCQNDLFSRKKIEIEECKLREHFPNSFIIAQIYHPKAGKFIRRAQNIQESDKKKLNKPTDKQNPR